ncbi:MAG: cobalt ECF transporter T component CbiQ, partial [Dictyoglomus sp.]
MNNFIDKTLNNFNSILREALFFEEKTTDSFLFQINERIKIISLIFILIGISFLKKIESILFIYFLSIFIAYWGKINVKNFLKRTWVFIPIFTLILTIPLIFVNPSNFSLGFYKEGLENALRFVLRVATSISYTQLLIMSTSWLKILSSLKAFRVPSLFVTILMITYRYIFLLLKLAEDLYLAKKSRTINMKRLKIEYNFSASSIGIMAIKSHELSKEVSQ